jgi:hypothetical protein
MAAFPNLPRALAARIIDLGNMSYLCREGGTNMRHDVVEECDYRLRELYMRLLREQDLADGMFALDGPSNAARTYYIRYATLRVHVAHVYATFKGLLDVHEAFAGSRGLRGCISYEDFLESPFSESSISIPAKSPPPSPRLRDAA